MGGHRMDRLRMGRLAALVAMKADIDLAALAAIVSEKQKIDALRIEVETGLAMATVAVVDSGEMAGFQLLEGHMTFANSALSRLDETAARLEGDRLKCRELAARSYGRARVLADLCAGTPGKPNL